MIIGGMDVATNTGRTVCDLSKKNANGENLFKATSFRPKAKRPFGLANGEVDPEYEGKVLREFRDDSLAWLVAEKIEVLAIEQPLRSNVQRERNVLNPNPGFGAGQSFTKEIVGGTQFSVIFRLYSFAAVICELCSRRNIPLHWVNQSTWRKQFYGSISPPKGVADRTKWWKEQAFNQCRILGIDVANSDSAESVGVAWWLRGHLNPVAAGRAHDLFRQPV